MEYGYCQVDECEDPLLKRVMCNWKFTEYVDIPDKEFIKMEVHHQNQMGEPQIFLGIIDKDQLSINTLSGENVSIKTFSSYDILLYYTLYVHYVL